MGRKTTPSLWMEPRCGSVLGAGGENFGMPDDCHQTSMEGGFFRSIPLARKHFISCGWVIMDDEWWCPRCAARLRA